MKTRNCLPGDSKEPPVFSLVVAPIVDFQFDWQRPRGRSLATEPQKPALKAPLSHLVAIYPLTSS